MDELRAEIEQLKEMVALDNAEKEKAVASMDLIEQEILQCIALELDAFRRVKEKEGKAFKYSDVTEEELRKVAEKRFERALEAVRNVKEKAKSKTS